jgi:Xaa-Pro aminopeptidase
MIERRQERLVARLGELGLDAMMVSDLSNVRYTTGYVGSNGVAVFGADGRRQLFTDSRYVVRARAETAGVEVVLAGRDLLDKVAAALGDAAAGGRAGVEADHVTLARHRRLTEALPGVELVPVSGVVEDLRVRKEPEEIARMREAAAVADRALEALAGGGLAGRTEREVAWALEGVMREAGAERVSFDIIVAAGPHGAVPHHVPDGTPIPAGTLVVVDLGAVVDGYCSDSTRTFATGPLPGELERAYAVCQAAQAEALAAVRPGIVARDLDAVAREHIAASGLGDAFAHGLGHGVGLNIHERPWVRPEGGETIETGMMLTVEPGIYLEGLGGVRIEDLVAVADDGPDILGRFPKDLVRL